MVWEGLGGSGALGGHSSCLGFLPLPEAAVPATDIPLEKKQALKFPSTFCFLVPPASCNCGSPGMERRELVWTEGDGGNGSVRAIGTG